MLESAERLSRLAAQRPDELSEAKDSGAVVVAYTGNFIPPEVIRACGAEPYPEWRGGDPVLPDAMLDESIRFLNPFARSTVGAYRLGMAPVVEMADLIAWTASDCHNQRMGEVMESYGLNVAKVGIPTDWHNASSFSYYQAGIIRLVERIKAVGGHDLDLDILREQIEKSNEIKRLLRALSDLRDRENPPIGLSDLIKMNHAAAIVDPDTAIECLSTCLEEAGQAAPRATEPVRLLLIGHAIAYGDNTVIDEIERGNTVVVTEILDEGCIWSDAEVSLEGDLLENLLKSIYLDRLPTSIMQPSWAQRMDEVERQVALHQCDGVLFYELLYDEVYDMEYTCLSKRLAGKKIPLICITSSYEYSREAMLPLQTRIDSFIGQLKISKKGA